MRHSLNLERIPSLAFRQVVLVAKRPPASASRRDLAPPRNRSTVIVFQRTSGGAAAGWGCRLRSVTPQALGTVGQLAGATDGRTGWAGYRDPVTLTSGSKAKKEKNFMTTCTERHHPDHAHQHGPNCGHTAIRHDGHVDYLHDGHLHHMHGDHVDEHVIPVGAANPAHCTPDVRCSGHEHGPNCGHEAIPHGDHVDYLVSGRLHHPHGDHCDDHGPVPLA
jgi:hypothetical protein